MATTRRARKRASNNSGSVYPVKRRGTTRYAAQVYDGYYDNGRPRPVRKFFDREADAQRALRAMLDNKDRGWALGERTTIGEYLDHWLSQYTARQDREAKTKQAHAYYIGLIKAHAIARVRLDKLTAEHVERFTSDLATRGSEPDSRGRRTARYAPSTVSKARTTLKKALDHAVRNRRLKENPAGLADPPKVGRVEPKPFSREEARDILAAEEGTTYGALHATALSLGLRPAELLGLQWRDVDLDRRVLKVRRQLEDLPGQGPRIKEILKTDAARRDLPMSGGLARCLEAHRDRQRLDREAAGDRWREYGLVFATGIGTPITPRNFNRHFTGVLGRLRKEKHPELELRGAHQLRHTCATLMFADGYDVARVSRILGHKSIRTTMDRYVHWLPTDGDETAAFGDRLLSERTA